LWKRARKAGIPLQIEGCDISPIAVEQARRTAATAGADIHFFIHDALRGQLLSGYDVATCSLFLHHLSEDDAVAFLRIMAASGRVALVNDLERSLANYVLVIAASRIVTRSSVVHYDAARSVEAAFTCQEAQDLARRAGLQAAKVARRWPCRYLLSWERS
jgi:2-polyprenyl-3-methyl-5-hydroxy-6-metoxy-1,4-benzoquinol methylase